MKILKNCFFIKYTQKINKKWIEYGVRYCIYTLLFFTFFISIPIIILLYLGIYLTRKRILLKLKNDNEKYYKFSYIIFGLIAFFSITMVFPLVIIMLLFFGMKIENKRYKSKLIKSTLSRSYLYDKKRTFVIEKGGFK